MAFVENQAGIQAPFPFPVAAPDLSIQLSPRVAAETFIHGSVGLPLTTPALVVSPSTSNQGTESGSLESAGADHIFDIAEGGKRHKEVRWGKWRAKGEAPTTSPRSRRDRLMHEIVGPEGRREGTLTAATAAREVVL